MLFKDTYIAPGCILMSKDSELGPTNKREHVVFVFWGLGYLSQYNNF